MYMMYLYNAAALMACVLGLQLLPSLSYMKKPMGVGLRVHTSKNSPVKTPLPFPSPPWPWMTVPAPPPRHRRQQLDQYHEQNPAPQ